MIHRPAVFAALVTSLLLPLASCTSNFSFAQDREPARWYKGNTHTHSLWSDGDDFPEMIVDWYHQNGYDFLAISDHNVLMRGEKWMDVAAANRRGGGDHVMTKYAERFGDWVQTREHEGKRQVRLRPLDEFRTLFEEPGRFLLIEGEEITDRFENLHVHINAVNLAELIPPQRGASVRETMRNNFKAVLEQEERLGRPILAHLNHPNFHYSITPEDIAYVLEEDFFEVYNGHGSINHEGDGYRPGDERMWDIANTIRLGELKARPLYAVATDDAHNYHSVKAHAITGRGWIMVRAPQLTAESIIETMRAGDFYASSGVTLRDVHFNTKTKTLTVEIEPVEGETYTTQFIGTRVEYDRTTTPALDKDGKEMPGRLNYSSDVGEVFATVEGNKVSYKLTGDELYVRATITSSAAPERPVYKDQKKKAWTQPVGWERYVKSGE